MASKFSSMRNLKFMLYEVFDVLQLTQMAYFNPHNKNAFDLMLDAANSIGNKLLHPIFEEMDRKPPELVNGQVKVHPQIRSILAELGENGWISACFDFEHDGDQLPMMITNCCGFIFAAANYSASVYSGLSAGAAKLITSFGNEQLNEAYVGPLLKGKWQGTMALTEPQAGSSLADIVTTAVPTDSDYYKLQGQKIFISAGDHDGVENIIHLVLGKIEGAPQGVKGISLFVVPKKRIADNGDLEANDVTVSQVFHKMGYRGAPITELNFGENDDCHGYLVGEPHMGLVYMFQMMNEARLGVGIGAAAIASAAYYAALEYARNRHQGRPPKSPHASSEQVAIIEHPDIKRMLLSQRAIVEGALSLLLQCSLYEDLKHAASAADREKSHLLLELLTPVAKTFPSEMGILATSQSIQCFGGYGYCEDFPVEQHFRDMRIHAIHEGTTGIQAMDLLGRKVVMGDGRAFAAYLQEVGATVERAGQFEALQPMATQLQSALEGLEMVTHHLIQFALMGKAEVFLADATLYLEMFGIISVAWQWLLQAIVAREKTTTKLSPKEYHFYHGKLYTCRFYFAYELPKILGLEKRLTDQDPITLDIQSPFFSD